jgi:hypothetical protein
MLEEGEIEDDSDFEYDYLFYQEVKRMWRKTRRF